MIFTTGGVISQIIILSIMLIGMIKMMKSVFIDKHLLNFAYITVIFWLMLGVSFILSPKHVYSFHSQENLDTMQQFKASTVFCLSLFTGYQIGLKKFLPTKQILITAITLTLLFIILFVKQHLAQLDKWGAAFTNNGSYSFLYIVPFLPLLFRKYKYWTLALFAIILVFVMIGVKRGAIVCLGALVLTALWWYFRYYKVSAKSIFLIALLLSASGGYVIYEFENNPILKYRLEQTEEGNSSGRDEIYSTLWDNWKNNPDFTQQLIGKGSAQTVRIAGNFAHNDWLELLIDNGLLGVIVYALMFISAFRFVFRHKQNKFTFLSMLLCLTFWFVTTLFSMGYTSLLGGIIMMLLGLQMGNVQLMKRVEAIRRWQAANVYGYNPKFIPRYGRLFR